MKKFLSVMLLAVILIFVSNSQAEAREVFMGYYSDGSAVYLLTETIEQSPRNTSLLLRCTVRAGRDYLTYMFEPDNGRIAYSNSEGYSGYINDGKSPIARAIYYYCM